MSGPAKRAKMLYKVSDLSVPGRLDENLDNTVR